ncbi:MAG TPA: enoyl-CoA hydratase-related protein [Mycobacteriales bacterium]|nr:enoyl-CoA hydratase-related protein [Mycobacteriales bacterium]
MPDPAPAENDADPVLLFDIQDRVATITLNRPERRNALNGALVAALDAAVKSAAADSAVKVVVLTGAPAEGRHGGFCAGGDVKDSRGPGMELGVPPNALDGDLARHDSHAAMLLHLMPKPTIAMVGGPAVGAGFSLAGACDFRYASDDAVFAASFTPNGLSGDYAGSIFWTNIVGTATARRLYLLNEKLGAEQAAALGMVHGVTASADLRDHVREIATRLAKIPGELVALVKENLNNAEDEPVRRRLLFANEANNQMFAAKAAIRRMQQKATSAAES